ncbi:MAG: hypothetical protein KC776_22265 [Myxococcales bacterium]|nr:hypothetical protein [Myxococcales bacterium]MCB9575921.1 hypothetical protein [Polyangiaceae bacterium]
MWTIILDRRTSLLCVALAVGACDKKEQATPEPAPSTTQSAEPPAEPEAGPCSAGSDPVVLDTTDGYVYDLAQDAGYVYYGRWQLYGNRGDLRRARKDGKGGMNLSSLSLEPRGVVVDDKNVYFTAGIRLMQMPKAGGDSKVLAPKFSSLSITAHDKYIYGVPGDYGPYDRLIRADTTDGKTYELDVSERPDTKEQPRGFSDIAADDESIFVTDSSGDRVLKFTHERAKPKVLANKQPKPFALGIDADTVYFTLAQKGDLMKIAKSGGKAEKIAFGLVQNSPLAVDDKGLVMVAKGKDDDSPTFLVMIDKAGGAPKPLSKVPDGNYVEVVGLDAKCVYWVQREAGAKTTVFARAR